MDADVLQAFRDVTEAMEGHALGTGHFEHVNAHVTERPLSTGLNCELWVGSWAVVPSLSGLNTVSLRVTMGVRLQMPWQVEPKDELDPALLAAMDDLCDAYCSDFTLGGLVSWVDLLGAHGPALSGDIGWIQQDETVARTCEITVSLILADLWEQSP